eukprot:m.229597 g.229597  ORF g.229597 m.229597 type:complete len:180 (+) comp17342_c0_seq3:177-716(+)
MAEGAPKVRAKHSYQAQTERELSFQKGDILTILQMRDDDWWEGCDADGNGGFIAAKYVEHKPIWMSSALQPSDEDESMLISPKPSRDSAPGIPNLAKALQMHHVKAKHEVTGSSSPNGLMEFKLRHDQVRKGVSRTQAPETELQRRLRERTSKAEQAGQEEANQTEFQRKFSARFKKPE